MKILDILVYGWEDLYFMRMWEDKVVILWLRNRDKNKENLGWDKDLMGYF